MYNARGYEMLRLPYGDQWKAEKGAFKRWPITRYFIKSDIAGLIKGTSINFRFNGEHWQAVQVCKWESLLYLHQS